MKNKNIKLEIDEKNAIEAVKKAAKIFAWNVDTSFAKLMLPIIEKHSVDASKVIDYSYHEMNFLEKKYCLYCDNHNIENKIYKYIKNKCTQKYVTNLNGVKLALLDILEEDTKNWNDTWGLKKLLPIKYNVTKYKDKYSYTKWEIKPEYEKNSEKNKKITKFNIKRHAKCYKWRKKQLYWFVNNLHTLWW